MKKPVLRALCITAAITAAAYLACLPLLRFLEGRPHPLMIDVTCRQSGAIQDFYWKLNQVFIARVKKNDSCELHFSHTVPNFAAYYIKMGPDGAWKKLAGDSLSLPLRDQRAVVSVRAENLFGAQTALREFSIEIKNSTAAVFPAVTPASLRDIPFRFEPYSAPDMDWMREQTLPVAGQRRDQMQVMRALRSWVSRAVPFGSPRKDSNWNAAAILRETQNSPGEAFLCDEHAAVFVTACISAGLNARMIHLRSAAGDGHYAAEVWSDQQQKWVFMDPLYNFSYCENSACFSTLELHNLYLRHKADRSRRVPPFFPKHNYLNLFHEFQVIMANDFLSHPCNSVLDILSGRIATLRWVDADTPPVNKWRAAGELFICYYVPKIGRPLIIALGILAGIVVIFYAGKNRKGRMA